MREINGSPLPTWQNIVAYLILATIIAGGAWTLFQSQFSFMKETASQYRIDSSKRDDELRAEITRINAELLARRNEFISVQVLQQLEKLQDERYRDIVGRLGNIEQTRPTTGELSAVAKSNADLFSKLDERVRSLETFVRQPAKSP